ncbi:MAG: sigma-70 family RNA polymerase sigma factor [Actinobacteria bacterium]|nr:sigma-70 family RNA polymerase sigma factor [Actinomycetota bacterium]
MTTSTRRTGAPAHVADAPSFESFYRGERDGLHRALTFAVGDHRLAGEVVDEAMVRAYERWSRIGRYDDPAGWVYRVAMNRARSLWRRSRWVRPGDPPDRERPVAELPDPELWAAVAALPRGQRDAVVLRFVLDWSYDRIGEALGVATSTARSRVARALPMLREDLEATS